MIFRWRIQEKNLCSGVSLHGHTQNDFFFFWIFSIKRIECKLESLELPEFKLKLYVYLLVWLLARIHMWPSFLQLKLKLPEFGLNWMLTCLFWVLARIHMLLKVFFSTVETKLSKFKIKLNACLFWVLTRIHMLLNVFFSNIGIRKMLKRH